MSATGLIRSSMNSEETLKKLEHFTAKKGLAREDFNELTYIINNIDKLIKTKKVTESDIIALKKNCPFLTDRNTIMGHIFLKPYGYAGDFRIIDRIYINDLSSSFPEWDKYSLHNSAAQAVRNRKEYFKKNITEHIPENGTLLNIASGPARDLFELYTENPSLRLHTTCVETDERAIMYAKELNKNYLDKIDFIHKNVFRFFTDKKFDVIWSAGLFDYFDDKSFVALLKKLTPWLKNKGQIIIGNFNENHNPSRAFMELFGEWFLIHRTEEQLIHLARAAGFAPDNIRIGREPENVNLFLHLKK